MCGGVYEEDIMINDLITEYEAYLAENNLPRMSADELLMAKVDDLTVGQVNYLSGFVKRWEDAEDYDS